MISPSRNTLFQRLNDVEAQPTPRKHPLPLRSMRIAVVVRNGLAVVTTRRVFANLEDVPIEATMTFPIAFEAVLTKLTALVDRRTLVAVAKDTQAARETYENALDRGKLSVLHEEKLRGVHMLSVGNLAPGKEIEVVDESVMPLALAGKHPSLRIPTTVADLYGGTPLLPADDIAVSRSALKTATLSVDADGLQVLRDGTPIAGEVITGLGQIIDLSFPGAPFGVSAGHAADGRAVSVDLRPAPLALGALDIGVLFDRSNSTGSTIAKGQTVWAAMQSGLATALANISSQDRVALFGFSNSCRYIGAGQGPEVAAFVQRLGQPYGGTELGAAIDEMIATGVKDILVITDGRTWRAEAHRAAGAGARITAVLVGQDSFDATIGHLAAMTGGQCFPVGGSDTATAISNALASMRVPRGKLNGITVNDLPQSLDTIRAGCAIRAVWSVDLSDGVPDAIGRYAASLALPLLAESIAADLAREHGLCTHLTSLVLVDEEGAAVVGIAETRQTPLLARRTVLPRLASSASADHGHLSACIQHVPRATSSEGISDPGGELAAFLRRSVSDPAGHASSQKYLTEFEFDPEMRNVEATRLNKRWSITEIAAAIDWDAELNRLLVGDLSGLAPNSRAWIENFERRLRVRLVALASRTSARAVAIGLIARKANNRGAERLSRKLLRRGRSIQ